MANEQLKELANLAVRGMEPSEVSAFVKMFEAGHADVAALIGKQAALRTINRNITMANIALSDPKIMNALTEAVSAA